MSTIYPLQSVPLDPALYGLEPSVADILKASTGISDDEELKEHIFKVQKEAYQILPYPYIRLFTFVRWCIKELPYYDHLLTLGKQRDGAILLEIGPGFGNDIRRIIHDGFPAQNIIATDLTRELWEMGHRLFRSSVHSFPVKFIQADVFDEAMLSSNTDPAPSAPDMNLLNTLTPLKGHVSVIILQSIFHLFDHERQALLAQRVAELLSPTPGSVIIGKQLGETEPVVVTIYGACHSLHSPNSWEKLWSTIFLDGTVEYHTMLVDISPELSTTSEEKVCVDKILEWGIKRL